MLARSLSLFVCCRCARELRAVAWIGRCPSCAAVNSMRAAPEDSSAPPLEAKPTPRAPVPRPWMRGPLRVVSHGEPLEPEDDEPEDDEPEDVFTLKTDRIPKTPCGLEPVDRVFGGGLPAHGAIMFAGAPGAGKSRLTLEVAARRAAAGRRVLLVSGEEQKSQIRERFEDLRLAERVRIPKGSLAIYLTNDLDRLLDRIDDVGAEDVYIDALNVLRSRRVATRSDYLILTHLARELHARAWASTATEYEGRPRCLIWAICHGTKDGDMAGPERAKHLMDAAFLLDHVDERGKKAIDQRRSTGWIRLGSLAKNRFGPADVEGFFRMTKPHGILQPWEPATE